VTRLLLDTSAYAAFMRGHAGIRSAIQGADEIYLNAIVLGELRAGFLGGRHRQKNEQELAAFLASPRVRVVDIDRETATRYVVIVDGLRRSGRPIPTNDLWIAASAMQHGLRLMATDRHYQLVSQIHLESVEPDAAG
jgi:predicted nucleic acid-binding protein